MKSLIPLVLAALILPAPAAAQDEQQSFFCIVTDAPTSDLTGYLEGGGRFVQVAVTACAPDEEVEEEPAPTGPIISYDTYTERVGRYDRLVRDFVSTFPSRRPASVTGWLRKLIRLDDQLIDWLDRSNHDTCYADEAAEMSDRATEHRDLIAASRRQWSTGRFTAAVRSVKASIKSYGRTTDWYNDQIADC